MEWHHIMTKQPEHDALIVQVDAPYEGHYSMGMRTYYQICSFEEILEYCKQSDIPNPNFWWVYAEDFPFPDKVQINLDNLQADCLQKWEQSAIDTKF